MYCGWKELWGADCDTDHFLLISRFKLKLQGHNDIERRRKQFSVDLEALKDIETQRKYATKVGNQLGRLEGQDINSELCQAVTFIKEVAEQSIGRMENKRNKWFNEACRRAIEKRRVMRDNYNKVGDQSTRETYEKERKNCKRVLQREKRNFLNEILQEDREGTILMEPEKKIIRWKEYFADLLDGTIPLDPIENKTFQKAEPLVKEISMEEVRAAIRSLKNCKAPGSDSIPLELIKYGGDDMGISLLNSVYKIFSKVLLNRLILYAEECLGEYQSLFRKGRSTIEQLSVIAQIIEKEYEFRQNMWQMFVDFRKAYDSIHRNSLYNIMEEFGFPDKLINLSKLAMEGMKYQVKVDNFMSEAFSVETGLKQGDALSPLLFNIALEKAIRVLQNESR
ncbi:hypothetical protein QTP88_020168 [Uroleucon formosanum]